MAAKMDEPILHMRGQIDVWITIAVAIFNSLIIYEVRLLSPMWDQELVWDPTSGILFAQ